MIRKLTTPLSREDVLSLRAGDQVLLSGVVYTARDAAHLRLVEAMERGEALPLPLQGQVIYYAGPTPTPAGRAIGSIGPTTSIRMDAYTPKLLEKGSAGHDWQGQAYRAGGGSHAGVSRGVFCRHWRRGGAHGQLRNLL